MRVQSQGSSPFYMLIKTLNSLICDFPQWWEVSAPMIPLKVNLPPLLMELRATFLFSLLKLICHHCSRNSEQHSCLRFTGYHKGYEHQVRAGSKEGMRATYTLSVSTTPPFQNSCLAIQLLKLCPLGFYGNPDSRQMKSLAFVYHL